MKLHNITTVNYDITKELYRHNADRVIRDISETADKIASSWYILNESDDQYYLNELLVNEGIKDILKQGVGKINDAITKGYSDLDAIKTKVLQGLKGKGDPGIMSKLGALAKKNAKYVKPAIMVAVIGASLLGMDTASASEALNQFDDMQGQEFQDFVNNLNQDVDGGQPPQVDQVAAVPMGVDAEGINALKTNIAREFVDSTLPNGQNIPKDAVLKALQTGKFDGMSLDQYLQKAMNFAQQRNMGPEQLLKVINPEIQQGMMQALQGSV